MTVIKRRSGVLLHVSSLHGEYSIGSFGKPAFEFVDFLAASGFTYWQVLPFCLPDDCDSPYKSESAFAGNPYFIDLPMLAAQGLLTVEELASAKQKTPYVTESARLRNEREPLLRLAASRAANRDEILAFIKERPQLDNACRFLALKRANGGVPWQQFTVSEPCEEDYFYFAFTQFHFMRQWKAVKSYANAKGIMLIGDLPIYVAEDSADVFGNRDQFLLDRDGLPTAVAGVPPDYFAKDGQLWGNPLYDWKRMKADDFSWWRSRMAHTLEMFDGVRIDHFRGIESYWSIPSTARTAKEGRWKKGPGMAFVRAMREVAGDRLIIAEDLGDITPEVARLVQKSGFPGMRVFQFAFLGDPATPHLPHTYENNCVAYTGTHDNNTLLGYVWELDDARRERMLEYCGYTDADWDRGYDAILRTMLGSHAGIVIFPIQDLLGFGSDTRMNTPGSSEGNWGYRMTEEQLCGLNTEKYRRFNELYGRI
ncbi:MAG: 4-alpha-glucanotransferase [Ruminococcaceae bacterium]|nr:4-alpha-glucanotransferase [Oscillospiraceae bacterium]